MNLNTIYTSLNLFAVINILLFCSFLFCRKQNTLPNIIMGCLLLIPGLYFVDNILISTKVIYEFPYAFFFVQILANLFPIGMYYYVHLLLGDKKTFHPFLLLGSIVTFIYSLGLAYYFYHLNDLNKVDYINSLNTDTYPITMDVYNYIFYAWQTVYFIVMYREVKAYEIKVAHHLSDLQSVKVLFVKQFVYLLILLNACLIVFYILFPMPVVDYGLLPLVGSAIYSFIIYYSIKNNAILNPTSYTKLNQINAGVNHTETYPEEDTKEVQLDEIATKIHRALNVDKVYKNQQLTLSDLANAVDEKSYLITKVLQERYNKNFYELINEYRIKEALLLLKTFDSQTDKIDTIAIESGFNSRATFYRSFKKITGKNPSDYL